MAVVWVLKGEIRGRVDAAARTALTVSDDSTVGAVRGIVFQDIRQRPGVIPDSFDSNDLLLQFGGLDVYARQMEPYVFEDSDTVGTVKTLCGSPSILLVVSINRDVGLLLWLTARQVATASLVTLPDRSSPGLSNPNAHPTTTKTFAGVVEWRGWEDDSKQLELELDSTECCFRGVFQPVDGLPAPAFNGDVRGQVVNTVFVQANSLAAKLGWGVWWAGGGGGRTMSQSGAVILKKNATQDPTDLANRVMGNCDFKGSWQLLMRPWDTVGQLYDSRKEEVIKEVEGHLQQVYGDMVFDETAVGCLTNFNQSLFLRRSMDVGNKTLEISPVVLADKKPVLAYLLALKAAEQSIRDGVKSLLLRTLVPLPPPTSVPAARVYATRARCLPPRKVTAETPAVDADPPDEAVGFDQLFYFSFEQLELSARWVASGECGNVVEGGFGIPQPSTRESTVIKLLSQKYAFAQTLFENEVRAYEEMERLQGAAIPQLFRYGKLYHTNDLFLELSKVAGLTLSEVSTEELRRATRKIKSTLKKIHAYRIVHNDLSPENIMLCPNGHVIFLDFGSSFTGCVADCTEEMGHLSSMLRGMLQTSSAN